VALLIIASLAAVIASQAVISGAFSVTQQAIQLGFIPRMTIHYTSVSAGQIYIPVINTALMVAVILLVLMFRHSSNLTAAYGIAVTGAMMIDNVLLGVVLVKLWHWRPVLARACWRCSWRSTLDIWAPTSPRSPMAAGCRWRWASPSSRC
jgi:KUP system potassium uptake protein